MTAGIGQEPNLEKQIRKQMGCMAGFFQIFDRHQILIGKRLCSANSLHSRPLYDSMRETQESVGSPAMSSELEKSPQVRSMPSPDPFKKSEIRSPTPEPVTPSQTSLPLPVPRKLRGYHSTAEPWWTPRTVSSRERSTLTPPFCRR